MIEKLSKSKGNVLGFRVKGRLHGDDYRTFVPAVESAIAAHGRARLLVEFDDFQGWDSKAFWEDVKFDIRHFADIERLAVVGEREREKWLTELFKPFTQASVRYFPSDEEGAAWTWLEIAPA